MRDDKTGGIRSSQKRTSWLTEKPGLDNSKNRLAGRGGRAECLREDFPGTGGSL
jgi:hypothetical protein